jgi:hypothetical protein
MPLFELENMWDLCYRVSVSKHQMTLDSETLNIWDEGDDAAGCTVETVERINAFLEPYQDAVDDEITRVLAAAACGQKRSVDNASDAGLCSFELQAMVYPNAGDTLFTGEEGIPSYPRITSIRIHMF